MMDKREVRKSIKERLSALSEQDKKRMSGQIAARVLRSEEYRRAHSLFLYLSTPEEADTRLILAQALAEGKQVYLPRIEGEDMHMIPYQEGTPTLQNRYGIFEPTGDPCNVTPDLAILPLLGFDRNRRRLGRGKGYYDRFLASYEGTSIAIAFSVQEWEEIPVEPFDRRPTFIITEKECIQ